MTHPVTTTRLQEHMRDARSRTIELLQGLCDEQFIGPLLPTVNPLQWEIGHVAWFHEYFILRRKYGHAPLLARGDALYDSIAIAHETRWDLPLYSMAETLDYMERVQDALLDRLGGGMASEQDSYLYQFTTFHEDMHTEAYTWSRQALAYPTPVFANAETLAEDDAAGPLPGDAAIPGGTLMLGNPPDAPFVFDNEKWAHPVTVAPFRMARAPVTNAEFAGFVDAGGYDRQEFWDADGWRWRQQENATHPVYWVPDGPGKWGVRCFDRIIPLPPHQPVIHVCWHEAQAWCRWANRRLPTEAEWEFAATAGSDGKRAYPWGDDAPDIDRANLDGRALGCVDVGARAAGDSLHGIRQMIGNVWEWTGTTFGPFPGFAPDDYREYSEPLFGDTKVLRGGAWTTRGRMIDSTYRNYFGPDRRDVFAGFRTCAVA
ncbi:MAG: selenoneine synthase SenA [Alphaproteobacteria bacterium]